MKLYLASKSPRRADLLRSVGIEFEVLDCSDFPEDVAMENYDGDLPDLPLHLARLKAEHGAKKVDSGLVLSGDTIIVFDGVVMGKPKGKDEARAFIKRLSGLFALESIISQQHSINIIIVFHLKRHIIKIFVHFSDSRPYIIRVCFY